jgi:hypothetical protein
MQVEIVESAALTAAQHDAIVSLCTQAYEEPFAPYLTDIGPGVHLLGLVDGQLVSHVMWVPRTLCLDGDRALQTAYVEAVATLEYVDVRRMRHAGGGFPIAVARVLAEHNASGNEDEWMYALNAATGSSGENIALRNRAFVLLEKRDHDGYRKLLAEHPQVPHDDIDEMVLEQNL